MAEYIERAAALSMREPSKSNRYYQTDNLDDVYGQGWDDALCCIERLPVADVVPVVHGCFVHDGPRFAGGVDWWHCSSCGRLASGIETRFDYCPNCGARMDLEN